MKKILIALLVMALLGGCVAIGFMGAEWLSQGELEDTTAALNAEIAALEADIAAKEAKITALEGEKAALTTEKGKLEADITALEAEKAELEADKAELEDEVETLEAEKKALSDENAELEASITAKNAEIATLNSSIASLTSEKATLATKVSELEASITAKNTEIAALTSDKAALEAEKATLTTKVTELEGDIEDKNAEIADLEADVANLTEEKATLTAKVSELNTEITTLNERIAELEASGEADETEITELKAKVSELESEKDALNKQVSELEETITTKDNEIKALNSSVNNLTSEKETLTTKVSELEASIKAKNNEIATLNSSVTTLTEEKTTLNERITELEGNIADKNAEIKALEADVATLTSEKADLEEQITTLNGTITTKNNEIATLNSSISALETEKADLEEQVASLEASISAKDTEITNLNSSVATLTAEKKTLTDRVEALEAKNKALESEKSELEKENETLKNCVKGNHSGTLAYTPNNDGTHYGTYSCCGTTVTEDHSENTTIGQTCLGYKCVVCGAWYGDKDADKHASDEFTYTANEDDTTHTKKHKCCGTVVSANEAHTVTEWTYDDTTHEGNCDHCGATVTEAHSGGTATCLVGKICEICGFEYEATNPNNHASDELTYTANEDETHSAVYSCCNALVYDYDKETNTYTVYSPVGLLAWGEAARAVISTGTADTNNDWYAEYTTDMPNLTLAADITLTGANNWTPLGYVSEDKHTYYPYIGTIDGNGHTITGLNINSTGDYIAFVGSLGPNSEVKNLTFKDATIIGGECVATVAADCGGNVTNCHVTGSSSVSGNNQVAGVVAWNGAGIISGCTNAATVTVNVGDISAGSGGVVGTNILNGIVIGCFNSGDITASASNRSQICGGVVGLNTDESIIIACGNTGKVVSSVAGVGGIAGGNYDVPVYACWTKETTEFKSGTEVSNKDGVGIDQDNTSVLHACYSFADTSAVADAITAMNTAIDEYNASAAEGRKCPYQWQVGTDGYPTLVEIDQTPTE